MSHDTWSRPPAKRPERHQHPAAETVAHLSKATYQQRVETLAERILPRLADERGVLRSVNYDKVLGHLKVIEWMSFDNPFSVLAHSEYELDAFDWERINAKHPVHGLAERHVGWSRAMSKHDCLDWPRLVMSTSTHPTGAIPSVAAHVEASNDGLDEDAGRVASL